ncbi:MAG: hypothetical protein LUQ14_01550 [Methanomassiliicoccales archaeon]|nr:hypothetical protein [Methanomassiliicoccales archaeon]
MEVMRLVVNDAQGVLSRVLAELVRRKVDVEKAFFGKEDGKVVMIIEVKSASMNGTLLSALQNLQDVLSAEYLREDYLCHWELSPSMKSERVLMGPNGRHSDGSKKDAEHCLYGTERTVAE